MASATVITPGVQSPSIPTATAPAASSQTSAAARRHLLLAQSQPGAFSIAHALNRRLVMLKNLMDWHRQRATRSYMDDRLLRDIGATRMLAQREAERRRELALLFWHF
jgi:uncharacterized protein YjiS (DUF1127 family)